MTDYYYPFHSFKRLFCKFTCLCSVAFGVDYGNFGSAQDFSLPRYQQTVPNDLTGADAGDPVDGLPKVRSLGKLVSLEGQPGDRGSLRPIRHQLGQEEFETGAEMTVDPESTIGDLKLPKLSYFYEEPYTDYRTDETSLSYMPGNGDQFGWVSFDSAPYLKRGYRSGMTGAMNMHLLGGPDAVPLPPRLYDFSIGYQARGRIQDIMSYDLATTVGVFSDFEDSARDGVRFPGHAVGMLHLKPEVDIVFGIDYLSRDDIKLLPVGGMSWRPQSMQDLRFDLVFPRPRIDYSLDNQRKLYLAGRLGGGSWDIEFPNDDNDVMTYRDLQLLVGYELRDTDGSLGSWEFGYVFDRRIEFRTLGTELALDDAFVIRLVTRK